MYLLNVTEIPKKTNRLFDVNLIFVNMFLNLAL